MSLILSSLAVAISLLALRESQAKPVRVNPPLPPLPPHIPSLPNFVEVKHYVN